MSYNLFIDDIREPSYLRDEKDYIIARNSLEAFNIIKEKGIPTFISFDHDLGEVIDSGQIILDDAMYFLRKFYDYCETLHDYKIPDYQVHSANPIGTKNIISFMKSWSWSRELYKEHKLVM